MSIELSNAQQFISWLSRKAYLNSIASKTARRAVSRGQVYWCDFGLNIGSEISKSTPRPAVIVSNYSTNMKSSNVIVVPVTHNQSQLPYLVPITPVTDESGKVILDGQVDTADVICVSKARLGDKIAKLSASLMKDIDKSLAISLDLLHYHTEEENKYNKLTQYVLQVKSERNHAQDTLKQLRDTISQNGFDEKSQEKIRELLDI